MPRLIVVIGATGGQGGSVIRALLDQPEYKLRGVTRDVASDRSKTLSAQGVEMVTADAKDEKSLTKAFEGACAIFAVTDFYATFRQTDPSTAMETEYELGVNMARAALKTTTLKHYIWSTLPSAHKVSKKMFYVPHFEAKARVDEFIKSQPSLYSKTTFLWVSFFDDNFLKPTFRPIRHPVLNRYLLLLPHPASTVYGFAGSQRVNIGVFVRGILSVRPESYGKYAFCNTEFMSLGESLRRWGTLTGKTVQFIQVSVQDYCELFPNYGWDMTAMCLFWDKMGIAAWSGEDMISTAALGIQEEIVGVEQAWSSIDWSSI